MTLNVTVLTPTTIFQSADFKLTDARRGKPVSNTSRKVVRLSYPDWFGFVTYAGLGGWAGRDLSEHLVTWLEGAEGLSVAEVAEILRQRATELLVRIKRGQPDKRTLLHTFVLAAFDGRRPCAYVVSNFQTAYGETRSDAADELATSILRMGPRGNRAFVLVTGTTLAVTPLQRRALQHAALLHRHDSRAVRQGIARFNATIARADQSRGRISEDCAVFSFHADGRGAVEVEPSPTGEVIQFATLTNGTNLRRVRDDAARRTGLDPSRRREIAYQVFGPQTRRLPSYSCSLRLVNPDPGARYAVREIAASDFEIRACTAVNDANHVIGTGSQTLYDPSNVPWISRGSDVQRLPFTGLVRAINSRGWIAVTVQEGTERAALFRDGEFSLLPLHHGAPGVFAGTDSGADAINAQGVVSGLVRSKTEEHGVANVMAAVFRPGDPQPIVLPRENPNANYRAVGINDAGIALVKVELGPGVTYAALWNPGSETSYRVGDQTRPVFPLALTNDGMVLATERTSDGSRPVLCAQGQDWTAVETPPSGHVAGMNENGDLIGTLTANGVSMPWLWLATARELVMLPYAVGHGTSVGAINNAGTIVGGCAADHGAHALIWEPAI